jgi:hypothetical protein
LPGSDERAERGVVYRLVYIKIIEDYDRRLAAEFQRLMAETTCSGGARQPARFRSAGKHQLVDAGMTGQGLARGCAEAGNDIEDSRR